MGFGNVLRVDQVYGNDATAALNKYQLPFLTITAALASAVAGETVYILPGTYNESIIIPTGVAVRGINVQTVTIQKLNVIADTTLVTMGTNTRLEDITLRLTSSVDGITLKGISFPDGTTVTAKVRVCVINVNTTAPGSSTAYGIYSGGTSALTDSSADALRGSTVNVTAAGTSGAKRAVFIGGANRCSIRDCNLYTTGTGTNLVGCEVNDPSGLLVIHTSTISGATYDISRPAGTLQLATTDLVNATTDGNGFTVSVDPMSLTFAITGNINTGATRYLIPGALTFADTLNSPFLIPFSQKIVAFLAIFKSGSVLPIGVTATFNVYKNSAIPANLFMTAQLNSTTSSVVIANKSQTFTMADYMIVELVTSAAVGTIPLYATIGIY